MKSLKFLFIIPLMVTLSACAATNNPTTHNTKNNNNPNGVPHKVAKNNLNNNYNVKRMPRVVGNTCPPKNGNFCQCYKKEVYNECSLNHSSKFICSHMKLIHFGMVMRYGSLNTACKKNNTNAADVQYCLDDWSCYLSGKYHDSDKSCGHKC